MQPSDPTVSVVIPSRNAAAVLADQLEALAGQSWRGSWEILLADNGSSDGTAAMADGFRGRLPLRVLDASARRGQAFARNAGAVASTAERILFCDADDVVGGDYVAAMVRCLDEEGAGLVAPRFDFARLNPAWVLASRPDASTAQSTGLQPYTYPPYLPHAGGSGLGVRRAVHQALGGFDETLPALEDTDYCWRAQRAGFAFRFCAAAVVHVRLRHDLGGIFRQAFSYGRHNVLMYKRCRPFGMPKLSPWAGPARWAKLALALPQTVSRPGRARWLSQLGWRLGRLDGCIRHRVLAP